MKCPKCGFQSFNYLATCKKCGRDLSGIRDRYRLGDPVQPPSFTGRPAVAAPLADDPFEASLPDEREIQTAAEQAVLEDEQVDQDLVAYLDETGAGEPALAADFDADSSRGRESAAPATDGGFAEDHGAAATGFPDMPSPCADSELAAPAAVQMQVADRESPVDDDVLLDDWLLDGETPAWRRSAAADFEQGAANARGAEPDAVFAAASEQDEWLADEDYAPVLRRASLSARMFAFLLDAGLLVTIFALFVLAGEYLRAGGDAFIWPKPQAVAGQAGPYFLVFFGLSLGYFTLFHYLGGQTPGKMVASLLVVDVDGEPLQLSQAFLRTAGGLLCLLPLGLGFCSALFRRDGRGWNDRLAGSMVIPAGRDQSAAGGNSQRP